MNESDMIAKSNDYILYTNNEYVYLAIILPDSKNCAQYIWEDFDNIEREHIEPIINNKVKEVVLLYQNTIGIMTSICPTTIHKEVEDILRTNRCGLEYQENEYTEIILSSTQLALEQDFTHDVWFININSHRICLDNEQAAKHIFRLIRKDIDNFMKMRWSKL